MRGMYLVWLLCLGRSLALLSWCRASRSLDQATLSTAMACRAAKGTLRCPVHSVAPRAWCSWLRRGTSLPSGVLRRGMRMTVDCQWGARWAGERCVAKSRHLWPAVSESAKRYLVSAWLKMRANGMDVCLPRVLQVLDLWVSGLDCLSHLECFLQCHVPFC